MHIWGWFVEASPGRTGSGFGPNPLTWTELQAFFGMNGITPRSWELRILRAFDRAFLLTTIPKDEPNGGSGNAEDRG